MNSCILMAQVVSNPELRSTQDQTSVSTMVVEFPSSREGEAPGTLQVEGWGNLAEEIKNTYNIGDQLIIEGRLSMNLIERDGIKEKKAKLVASKIYASGMANTSSFSGGQNYQASASSPGNAANFAPTPPPQAAPVAAPTTAPAPAESASANEDWDEIPF